jgi:hypothetical protein
LPKAADAKPSVATGSKPQRAAASSAELKSTAAKPSEPKRAAASSSELKAAAPTAASKATEPKKIELKALETQVPEVRSREATAPESKPVEAKRADPSLRELDEFEAGVREESSASADAPAAAMLPFPPLSLAEDAPYPAGEPATASASQSTSPAQPVAKAPSAPAPALAGAKSSQPPKVPAPISVATMPSAAAPAAPVSTAPPTATSTSSTAGAAAPVSVPAPAMDRDFILRNQIVERYISGKLPIKGATEFEKFCTENPAVLDELGLPERVNAGLRLLEAAGKPEPWQEAPKKLWQKPQITFGLAGFSLALLICVAVLWNSGTTKDAHIAKLQKQVAEQPLDPATTTRTIRLLPSFKGSSNSPAVVVGGGSAQLADLKLDLSRSAYRSFRITIDRIDQGRVAILQNVGKDSNGHVRVALNTTALGPGNYQFTMEGINWKGETVPEAWITVGISR